MDHTIQQNSFMIFKKMLVMAVLFVAIFMPNEAKATHIVGGNITYRYLGFERYEITLQLRRDCFNGAEDAQFDNPASIGIYDQFGNLLPIIGTFGQILIRHQSNDTLVNDLNSECGFAGFPVCVHETTYVDTLNLPVRPGGYILSYQRCCRNVTLNNIVDPLETGSTKYIHIKEEALLAKNSTPKFNVWADIYICANEDIEFDHSATDVDGDSLVYYLCMPNSGASKQQPLPQPPKPPPYGFIEWAPGYSLENIMGGEPLTLDAKTGLLTGKPNNIGQFLVGICVEEYRNGVLLSRVKRDFEYNVRICQDPPEAAFEAPKVICDESYTVNFNNTSLRADTYKWYFDYPNSDPTFSSTAENPTFTYPAPGIYRVRLEARRILDGCLVFIEKDINVLGESIEADFDFFISECNLDNFQVSFSDASIEGADIYEIDQWEWTIIAGNQTFNSNLEKPVINLPISPSASITLKVTSSSGCDATLSKTIDLNPVIANTTDFTVLSCAEDNVLVRLTENTANVHGFQTVNWLWKVDLPTGVQMFDQKSIEVLVPRDTDISYTLETQFDNGCPGFLQDMVNAKTEGILDFTASLDGCKDKNILSVQLSDDSELFYGLSPVQTAWEVDVDGAVSYLTGSTVLADISFIGNNKVKIINTYSNGCVLELEKTINPDDLIGGSLQFEASTQACNDEGVFLTLTNSSDPVLDGSGVVSVEWFLTYGDQSMLRYGETIVLELPPINELEVIMTIEFQNGCILSKIDNLTFGITELSFLADQFIICANDHIQVVQNPNSSWVYQWSPTTGLDFGSGTDLSNPTITINQSTVYKVTVTNGACQMVDSIAVYVAEDLGLVISGDAVACKGKANLSVGPVQSDLYVWSDNSNFSNIIGTGNNVAVEFDGDSQLYFVKLVIDGKCESETESINIANDDLKIDFLADKITVCDGSATKIIANANSNYTYQWAPLEGLIFDDPNDLSNPSVIVTQSTEYFVTVTNGECQTTSSIVVEPGGAEPVDIVNGVAIMSCTGQSSLTASGSDSGNYEWSLSPSFSTILGTTNPITVDLLPGDQKVYVRAITNNVCGSTVDSILITNDQILIDFVTDPIVICDGTAVRLIDNPNPNWTYVWSPLDGLTFDNPQDFSNPLANPSSTTTYTVTVSNANCEETKTIQVKVDPLANLAIQGNAISCDGLSGLSIAASGSATVRWSDDLNFANILSTTDNLNIALPTGQTTYYVEVTSADCGVGTDSFTVSNEEVSIDFNSSPFNYCSSEPVPLVQNPNSQWTYMWSPMEGLIFNDPNDLSNPLIQPTQSTTYSVTVSNASCSLTSTIEVIVDPLATFTLNGNTESCDGFSNLSVTYSDDLDIKWSTDPNFGTILSSGDDLNLAIEGASQIYYVKATSAACGERIESIEIANNQVALSFVSNPFTFCSDAPVSIVSNPNSAWTYQWSSLEGLTFADPNDLSNPTINPTENVSYSVTVSNGGCSIESTIDIMVGAEISVSLTGDTITCDGNTILTATNSAGVPFVWSTNPDFSDTLSVGNTLMDSLEVFEQTYYVKADIGGDCISQVKEITVLNRQIRLVPPPGLRICFGDTISFRLTNTFPDMGLGYAWMPNPRILSDLQDDMVTVTALGIDEEEVVLNYFAVNDFGCNYLGTVRIPVGQQEEYASFDHQVQCGEFEICFESGLPDGEITWDFGDMTTTDDVSTASNVCYTYPGLGRYEVTVRSNAFSCGFATYRDTVVVPEAPNLQLESDTAFFCMGEPITIQTNIQVGEGTIVWCTPAGDSIGMGNIFTFLSEGEGMLVAKYTDNYSCSDTAEIFLTGYNFDLSFDVPEPSCPGESMVLNLVDNRGDNLSYAWAPLECILSDGNTPTPTIWATESKDVIATVTNMDNGCVTTVAIPVEIFSIQINIEANPEAMINLGESVILTTEGNAENATYEWSTGETTSSIEVMPTETTTYTVIVTDENTCSAAAEITITVRQPLCDETDIFLPTAFSPNGDNINDVLYVRSNFIKEMELIIYNRWGEEVFSTTNPDEGWNGQYKQTGKELAPDAYAYSLKVICINDFDYYAKGNVNLLR